MLRNSRGEGQGGRGESAAVPPSGLWKILYISSALCFFLLCACVHTCVCMCVYARLCVLHNHHY